MILISISLVLIIKQSLYVSNISLLNYADKDNNFILKYPNDWDLKKEEDSILLYEVVSFVLQSSSNHTKIVVTKEKLTEPMTLSSYIEEKYVKGLENSSNFKQLKILQNEDAIFANRTAKTLIYTTTVDSKSMKYMEVFAMKDLYVYSISYKSEISTYDRYKPVAEKIIHSFKIIP